MINTDTESPGKEMEVVEVVEALYTLERQTGVDSRQIADFLEGKCWADSSEIKDKMRIFTNHF